MNPPHQAPSVQQLACRESQSAKSHGKETHKHIHVPRNRRHTCKFYPHLSKQITGIALRGDTETGAFNTSTVQIGCVCTKFVLRYNVFCSGYFILMAVWSLAHLSARLDTNKHTLLTPCPLVNANNTETSLSLTSSQSSIYTD